jgi:cobalt/nickel transport protein
MQRAIWAFGLLLLAAGPAAAHFNMLLPTTPSAKKGEEVVFTYQWGHPFEHELFDAPAPESVTVLGPDGKTKDLAKALEKVSIPAGDKKVTAYRFRFTPELRGDYIFLLQTPNIAIDGPDGEGREQVSDTVKVVLHVQSQKGWDAKSEGKWELLPLTRPYGLEPGMAFQAQSSIKEMPSAPVEVERYNATPPKDPPPDEHRTRTVKADPNGVVTATLTDPGWWAVTASREDGKARSKRTTLWVFVDEKPGSK